MSGFLSAIESQRVYIIAEAGVNHNGDIKLALELVDAAVAAGADGVKFQTFSVEQLVAAGTPKANYQNGVGQPAESQAQMLEKLALSESEHRQLQKYCLKQGIDFLSTPFDCGSLKFLVNDLGLDVIKLSSGAITHGPLLLAAGESGANIILSTGLSSLGEVEQALMILSYGMLNSSVAPSLSAFASAYHSKPGHKILQERVTLLHCTSQYPAPIADLNLRAITTLKDSFAINVGFSDHSKGIIAPLAAVASGAVVVEKHFTLDCNMTGPDHKASLSVDELAEMVRGVRDVELALGSAEKSCTVSEEENRVVVRGSLTALVDIPAGEVFTEKNMGVKRPGRGVSPVNYWAWLGKRAGRDFLKDEAIE
ncbi:MAG: N-acetylneuraminate synthase [Magnetococcales bacterium]|nr:N-acetylneuraminate synthase [Magnetococcales bacterium]